MKVGDGEYVLALFNSVKSLQKAHKNSLLNNFRLKHVIILLSPFKSYLSCGRARFYVHRCICRCTILCAFARAVQSFGGSYTLFRVVVSVIVMCCVHACVRCTILSPHFANFFVHNRASLRQDKVLN